MTEQDKALETIRRLLRLGSSSNHHEAELALSKAAELARRHSINLDSVKANEQRARIIEKTFSSKMSFDQIEGAAAQICMALFRVKCVYFDTEATYIGFEHNVETAVWAHAFVIEQCGRDLSAFRRSTLARKKKALSDGSVHDYCIGWAIGVKRQYDADIAAMPADPALDNSKTALILAKQDKEVDEYMEAQHGNAEKEKQKRRRPDDKAFMAGIRDGSKVSISRPIKDGSSQLKLTNGGTR
jgi:hypothetical protein